jgi:Bacterial Ig-like domain (group 1)
MIPVYSPPSRGLGRISLPSYSVLSIVLLCIALGSVCSGQVAIPTSRSDNTRSGANTSETMLTPANVNKNEFGQIFSYSIDYLALAQPLYVPNVNINVNGQVSTHNVVYVATMADSVYAFDADSNTGSNASPLWWVNFTDIDNNPLNGPVPGLSTASGQYLPCSGGNTTGFTQEGIAGTPVIDTTTGTLYVIAKTMQTVNGTVTVYHYLHALDITSGAEKYGGPVQITAQVVYNNNPPINFNSLHELNRPGLLLLNGVVYAGFGSNGCNDDDYGWLLAYDETTLQQVGSFNTSADRGLASIWQTGNGIAADDLGNIFAVTAESTAYTVPNGGVSYCNSVLEFINNPSLPNQLVLNDYFTPDDVSYLNVHDLDLSAGGPVVLPDQTDPTADLVVAGGKTGTLFVLNRNDMGQFNPTDSQLSAGGTGGQEIDNEVGHLFDSPAYWNGMLYYAADADEIKAFALTGTYPPVSTEPVMTTTRKYVGSHSPSISANGNTNGVLWVISGGGLYAFNAANLSQVLYISTQNAARDKLPPIAHFATQIVAGGKVYVATQTTLSVYGLLQNLTLVSGGNQTGPILTTLPTPIQVQVADPYTGVGIPNVSVSFSDGGKKGNFNPPGPIVSDSNGYVSTSYTFSKTAGTYTLTASSAASASLPIVETATPGPVTQMVIHAGNKQSGQAGSILPTVLSVATLDAYKNGVPGTTVTYVDKSGAGTLNPSTTVTNSSGFAPVTYQLPNTDGTYKIAATASQCSTCKTQTFTETATGDAPASVGVVSGNNQSAPVNTALPQPLVVQVNDAGGNPIAGVSVTFAAPSGTLSSASATTNASGQASVNYTTGSSVGNVTITAAVDALNTQFTVNVTAGAPATVTISGGNNQFATAGTTLPQPLSVVVADQYGNPVSGVAVNFTDNGAGGSFYYANPVTTNNSGTASQIYTLPPNPGTVSIYATAAGVPNPAVFTETGQ